MRSPKKRKLRLLLNAVSIVLLIVHVLVQKLLDALPNILLKIFYLFGGDQAFVDGFGNLYKVDSKWLNSEIATLEKLFERIITDGSMHGNLSVPSMASQMPHLSHTQMTSRKVAHFFETPITSIMLPTTILSVFLLMTMTMFLIFHLVFQGLMFMSALLSTHSDGTISNSPVMMAGIMFLLLIENVLPWMVFATGVYLSLTIGGSVWCLFSCSTYILWIGLRALRTLVFTRFQDGRAVF